MALLRGAGHCVRLLAPPPGDVLVASDRSGVRQRLPWDGPETARLLAGEATSGPVGKALSGAGLVVAYTRSEAAVRAFERLARRLLVVDPAPPAAGPHASLWLATPIAALAMPAHDPALPAGGGEWPLPPDLPFSPEEHALAETLVSALPRRFLAVHPGSGSPAKNWPAERFLAFAARHAAGAPWLLVLGPAEQDRDWEEARAAVLARDLPLRVLGAVLSRAGLFLGNDSGISHLAAAAGAPTLALFGPTDPVLWSPVGRSVRCLRAHDGCGPAGISLENVLSEAKALRLTSAASGPPSG